MSRDELTSEQAYQEQVVHPGMAQFAKDIGYEAPRDPYANAHGADCLFQAADHIKAAIAMLLASNRDDVEPIVHVLRPVAKQVAEMAKP